MADRLIFPIGFDLNAGIEQAARDWEKSYAGRLSNLIKKNPVKVKLRIDVTDPKALEDVKRRIKELRLEPITPETKAAIKELAAELRTLAAALKEVQKYSTSRATATPDAVRAARINEINTRTASKAATEHERARAAAARATAAELRLAKARERGAASARIQTEAYKEQSSYIQRLTQRLVALWSIQQVGTFLTKVREVTAEFELQRISLGAIIQDQARANTLFSEIKNFALQSPVKILDLTKYTKQLAAYKIGVEDLFDTTKRLTDISVGLGVSMDRLVLFYGQVRAAGYLRASEIRQATEAGIPLVEELAKKLSDANGELVTAAQVMDMVSKRAISFEMVKEVFEDMTNAGGMFYNMQEKQGNTLYGMWQKLGDAAAVMYEEIGNTESVNKGMKDLINLLRELMINWRDVWRAVKVAAGAFAIYKINAAIIASVTQRTVQLAAANRTLKRTREELNYVTASGNKWLELEVSLKHRAAIASKTAAMANSFLTKSYFKLKAALLSLASTLVAFAPTIAITGIFALIGVIDSAIEKSNRLKKALGGIKQSAIDESDKSVRNFESLAYQAVHAADGTKEQRDALDELRNTYSKIIPAEDLRIENLRKLAGNYDVLTTAIRNNIAAEKEREAINKIVEKYTNDEIELKRSLEGLATKEGVPTIDDGAYIKVIDTQFKRIFANVKRLAKETNKDFKEIWKEAYAIEGIDIDLSKLSARSAFFKDARKFVNSIREEEIAINDLKEEYKESFPLMGKFARYFEDAQKRIGKITIMSKENTYAYDVEVVNKNIESYVKAIEEGLKDQKAKVNLSDFITISTDPEETSAIDFKGLIKAIENDANIQLRPELIKMVEKIQEIYGGLVPTDAVTIEVRNKFREIAKSFDVLDMVKSNMIGIGEGLDDYRKKVNDLAKSYAESAENLARVLAATSMLDKNYAEIAAKQEKEQKKADFYAAYLDYLGRPESGRTSQSDPRLGILKEMASDLQKINKEYDDLLKKEGKAKALADTQKIYADTLKRMQELAKKYKFELPKFEVPTDTKSLTAYLDSIRKAMAKLPKSDKDVLGLTETIGKINVDEVAKGLEKKLKQLQDRISQTKTAKDFFEKILAQTGDVDIATQITISVYGEVGNELFDATVKQIEEVFKSGDITIHIPIEDAIDVQNQRINYARLAAIYEQYQDALIDKNKDTAKKIVEEGQKVAAEDALNWQKMYEKAKSYEEQISDVIRKESAERQKIIKSYQPQDVKDQLISQSYAKQAAEIAKLSVKEFQSSEDYIKVFQDLDKVSGQTLDRMKTRLEEMIAVVKGTKNVEGLKALVEALEKIKKEQITRDPVKGVVEGIKKWIKARKDYRAAQVEEAKVKSEWAAEEFILNTEITDAKFAQSVAQERLNDLEKQGLRGTDAYAKAQSEAVSAADAVTAAVNKRDKAYKKAEKAEQKTTDALDNERDALAEMVQSGNAMAQAFNNAASTIQTIADVFGIAEDSELGDIVSGLVTGLQTAATVMTTILSIAIAIEGACWWLLAIGAAVGAFTAIFTVITNSKVRKANREIERQQKIVDSLTYSYSRLEKAMEKALGSDYASMQAMKLRNLYAQQAAYQKQYDAELSKGKKADKDKLQDYADAARDVADQIKDMEDEVVNYLTGTDITSAARDFANAWLDAYASFENTADALKEKFHDMIKSMVVESVMARLVQAALKPVFDAVDAAVSENGNIDQAKLIKAFNLMEQAAAQIDSSLYVAADTFESMGFNIREALQAVGDTDLTGISRTVGNYTEEELNANTAALNTQNFYISQIHADVAAIKAYVVGDPAAVVGESVSVTDLVTMQNTYLSHLPAIAVNTAQTAERCERAAVACERIADNLSKVTTVSGNKRAIATTLS